MTYLNLNLRIIYVSTDYDRCLFTFQASCLLEIVIVICSAWCIYTYQYLCEPLKTGEVAKCTVNEVNDVIFTYSLWGLLVNIQINIFSVCLTFCPQFYGAPDLYESMLKYLNIVFTGLFTLECILKVIAFNPLVSCLDHMLHSADYH